MFNGILSLQYVPHSAHVCDQCTGSVKAMCCIFKKSAWTLQIYRGKLTNTIF